MFLCIFLSVKKTGQKELLNHWLKLMWLKVQIWFTRCRFCRENGKPRRSPPLHLKVKTQLGSQVPPGKCEQLTGQVSDVGAPDRGSGWVPQTEGMGAHLAVQSVCRGLVRQAWCSEAAAAGTMVTLRVMRSRGTRRGSATAFSFCCR